MTWNYAELSKMAKGLGGPEALTEFLVQSGRKEMAPWMVLTGLVCAGAGAGIIKLVDFFKSKRRESDEAVEAAKQELIRGINQYDAEHTDNSNDNSNEK